MVGRGRDTTMSAKPKRTEIRGSRKMAFLGFLGGVLVKILGCTLRYRIEDPEGILPRIKDDPAPLIHCLWHNQMLSAFLCLRKVGRAASMVVLTSASKDGAALESLAKSFGCGAVRGSTSRRGRAALVGLTRALAGGQDAAITPDGPRGPRYSLQGGVVKLAQATGVPLLAPRFECSAVWQLKSWDRFRIPKPFSTLTLILDPPLDVPRRLEEDQFESIRSGLEQRMREGLDDLLPEHTNNQDHEH